MADNTTLNAGTGGDVIASDDIGGVKFQRVKLVLGADGANDGDVSGANPVPVAGPLTDAQLRAAALPVSLTGAPSYLEDAAHSSGDRGVFMLAVRRDDLTLDVDADGDYAPLQVNAVGRLKVSAEPASQDLTTGNITTNTGVVSLDVSRTSNIMLHCVNTGVTGATFNFEGSLNSTNGTNGNWFAVQAVRTNANTIEVTATAIGATPVYGWEISVNGLRWFRVRASAGTFGTSVWSIQPAPYATEPIPAAQISGTQPVSGTVTLGAGTAAAGDVGVQYRANATGAASQTRFIAAATANPTVIKASAGRLLGYDLINNATAVRYVKLHNIATSPTAGSTAVVGIIPIGPNGGKATVSIPGGIGFATGIAITTVTGAADADATAVGANDIVGTFHWA